MILVIFEVKPLPFVRFLPFAPTLLLFCLLTTPALCQWTDLSTARLDIQFKDENTGWMVGSRGLIQKTTDGGKTWFNIQSPVEYDGQKIIRLFVFGDHLKVVVNKASDYNRLSHIYSSPDGGETWTRDLQINQEHIDAHFMNESVGWYWIRSEYNYSDAAYRTIDGGTTWTLDAELTEVSSMFSLGGTTWTLLVKSGTPNLWKSIDQGLNWTKNEITPSFDPVSTSLQFIDDQHGWLANSFMDQFYKTSDGGVTWEHVDYDPPLLINGTPQVQFVNSTTGFINTNDGLFTVIYKTTDAGLNWHRVLTTPDPYTSLFQKLYFRDALHGFVIGQSGYMSMTVDGGDTWTQTNLCPASGNFPIEGLTYNGEDIWAIGEGILHNSSNGHDWTIHPEGRNQDFNDFLSIAFGPGGKGIFVGESAYASSENNGETWTFNTAQFEYHSQYYHEQVMFDKAGNIWVKNVNGPLYKSTDGGRTYKLKYSFPSIFALADYIAFQSDKKIWYYGDTWLLRSKDGGDTWTRTDERINVIHFLNPYVGWKVLPGRKIQKTIDGGDTWQPISTVGHLIEFKFMYFADEFVGWIVDTKANVFKTTDGGSTWTQELTGAFDDINAAVFRVNEENKVEGYIGGARLMKFNSGYTPVPFLNVNPPSGLAAELNGLSVSLSWNDNSTDEDGYIIQKLSGTTWEQIGTIAANQYENLVLDYGEYTYRIGAYKQGRIIAMSEPLTVNVAPVTEIKLAVVSLSPARMNQDVDPATSLVIEFNTQFELVYPAAITIEYSNETASDVRVVPLTASNVVVSGNILTIDPGQPLPYASNIVVKIQGNTIRNEQASFFEGINDWTFMTAPIVDDESPLAITLSPLNGATDVDPETLLNISFNETIVFEGGQIRILDLSSGGDPITIDLNEGNTVTADESVTITLPQPLPAGTSLSITIDQDAFADLAGNPFVLVHPDWTFTTKPNVTAIEDGSIANRMEISQWGNEIIIQNEDHQLTIDGIFDVLGRTIPYSSNDNQIAFSKPQGIFLIRYRINGGMQTEKIFIRQGS